MNVDSTVGLGLGLMLAVLAVQRVSELLISRQHEEALRARGAVEFGREQLPWFVALHLLLPLGTVAEVLFLGVRPGQDWPWMFLLLVVAAMLRAAAIRALGERWHVRVWVIPGERPFTHGVYRLMRHPNYFAVILECAALPLLFGAWRTAIVASTLNLLLLAMRIRVEEQALAWAAGQPAVVDAATSATAQTVRA
jgi:methyltransferase